MNYDSYVYCNYESQNDNELHWWIVESNYKIYMIQIYWVMDNMILFILILDVMKYEIWLCYFHLQIIVSSEWLLQHCPLTTQHFIFMAHVKVLVVHIHLANQLMLS